MTGSAQEPSLHSAFPERKEKGIGISFSRNVFRNAVSFHLPFVFNHLHVFRCIELLDRSARLAECVASYAGLRIEHSRHSVPL